MVPEARTLALATTISQALVSLPLQPKGPDSLIECAELDVKDLALGETISESLEINQFLNPSGALVLYVIVNNPANARYNANIYVNDCKCHHFSVDTFVPPVLQFPSDQAERPLK